MSEFRIKDPEIIKSLGNLTEEQRQVFADLIVDDLNKMSPLHKIENLSRYAWQQVRKNPEEAEELFKMIYEITKENKK